MTELPALRPELSTATPKLSATRIGRLEENGFPVPAKFVIVVSILRKVRLLTLPGRSPGVKTLARIVVVLVREKGAV